jgi:hypothetical protein
MEDNSGDMKIKRWKWNKKMKKGHYEEKKRRKIL